MRHDSTSWQRPDAAPPSLADESALLEQVLYEVKKVVVPAGVISEGVKPLLLTDKEIKQAS